MDNLSNNVPISEQFRTAADEWVDAEAAASLLEETKSSLLAQRCAELGDIPVNRAEQTIKASADWHDHLKKIVDARTKANRAKMQLEYLRMCYGEWQSQEANNRTEARL